MNRKRISAFFTIVMVLAVILSLSACDVQGLKKPDAPVVTVSETGLASWEAVEGAVGYKYKINNGFEKETVETFVQLQHNETIVVKAGEKIAIDGVIERGSATLNMMALTGETVPVEVTGYKPIAHIQIDSRTADKTKLEALESKLYGSGSSTTPEMPLPAEVITMMTASA